MEIGQIFAAQTAAAIENARLFKAEEKRAAELEILRQVSLGLTASLEPKSVLDAILDGVFKLIPDVKDAHIFTYDGERLAFGSALWYGGHRGELFSEPRQDGLTYNTARSGETIVINDFKTHPLFSKKAVEENWVGSIVGIPFKIGERVVGVLNVAHQETFAFSKVDLRILRLLGDQAALAIDNARLFEQTMMERRHISLLYDVGQALAISLDPEVIMERALTLTCQALEGNVGAVWSFNHDEDHLFLQVLYAGGVLPTNNLNPEMEMRMGLGETIVGWSALQKKSINIPDVTQDDRWTEIPYIDEEVHSMVTAPFSDGQNLLGVMTILHNQIFAFTDDHLDLLESICRQVGLALSNARRYQDVNRLVNLLAAEQYRLESLIEILPVGVLLLDENHRLLLSNPLGIDVLDILSPQRVDNTITHLGDIMLAELLESQDSFLPFEISLSFPQRRIFEAQARKVGGESVQWVLTLRDVTHEREIQDRVQMQDRLATVGQLAAGIAHDFNNIMATIVVYADLLMMEQSLSEASQERLTIIQQQVQRASSLIRQILDFSRRSVMEQSSLNLLPLLKEMQRLLERTLPETIQLDLQYEDGDYTILADPTRLQQVLMNLAVNARDAMADGGFLSFSLAHFRTQVGVAPPVMEMPPGAWIRVSVSDTGVGIHPDNLSRIFEPFFTTKPVGQGTGLGLAQVYGIVKQHEGYIDVTSSVGKGTRFDIYLPVLVAQQDATEYEIESGTVDGAGKTVLLVEDDPSTRTAVQHLLISHNFHVLLASNGSEALKILEESYSEITLVVSDIVMPEMGGMDLYTVMQIRWPDIQVLFITGHPLEEQDQGVLERGNVDWLQKPFSLTDFSQAVQRLIDQIG
jgi:signal transduction histidine kinase/ActR/RegA family two-component response regulator